MTTAKNIAVVGAGRMGMDHAQRLQHRIEGARLSAVVDIDSQRAQAAAGGSTDVEIFTDPLEALASDRVDALIIATPGAFHKELLLAGLEAGKPMMCEKPLTPDAASAREIVEAESKLGQRLIQVGFMRRYDEGYMKLHRYFVDQPLGVPLMLHCAHRNPDTPDGFTNAMLIEDSVVHEFDIIRFLTSEEIVSVQVRSGRAGHGAAAGLKDPQQVLIETSSGLLADVEIFVNARFGYQVATQAVFADGIVDIDPSVDGLREYAQGRCASPVSAGFVERFGRAYDTEIQGWVNALHRGSCTGASVWDGLAAACCCEAGVRSQQTGERVKIALPYKPDIYR
ncbi:Gfo/Idh/MocA family protein [Carnimonas nigrificans]|uniref:Gfo/Idh/MocA family protein n=1 Tax=Carnimonas nigrificans TaxID=64323 RepID=UPI00046FDF7A|nr:Gfo/Idh/MocA family oxidoreductase [Carnimonas nigrificans]